MAKRKKRVSRSKPKRRTTPMATKRRRKKRTSTAVRRTLSAKPKVRRRRKKKGMLGDAAPKKGFMPASMTAAKGALGGGAFLLSQTIAAPLWIRTLGGFAVAVGSCMYGAPAFGAGVAGATVFNLGKSMPMVSGMLHDDGDDMQDAEYVDPDTLSDSGYMDEDGNSILVADDGIMYALNDNNELEAFADAFDLQDDFDLNDGIQSVSMNTLAANNAFALANAGY